MSDSRPITNEDSIKQFYHKWSKANLVELLANITYINRKDKYRGTIVPEQSNRYDIRGWKDSSNW